MSEPANRRGAPKGGLTRRGLFRGVGTATLLGGCVDRTSTTDPGGHAVVDDATAPAELGPDRVPVRFTLNGESVEAAVEPRTTLLDALRLDLDTTGPKLVCDRGSCSACLVLVDGLPRNSCMMLAHDVAGREVTTVEGLSKGDELSALQHAFVRHDALQCGFCTSGMLISCAALLRRRPKGEPLTATQVQDAIAGNLCRCGTYPHVVAAVLEVASGKTERAGA
ncbi:(2Fe-2S)-binding protein [Paraliomyxa miuraensis]|uniref:(2Fe-2S)-binding protein n=1 Tax=Paraliomyxa miuraensis TaxID=376150 RepID=UPI00225AF4D2|nr:(2Fe-2S)-binding protein [Paraliomyxa miuraensis]MCX4244922.1 (2Fe-2S)-binding protein [Paraliomyxa miuraensis]